MPGHHKARKEGKIDSKRALDRTLPATIAVLFGLAFLGVYTNIYPYPITSSNIKSAAEVVIPVLETDDADPTAGQSSNDTPTPILLPTSTQSSPSEDMKMASDPEMREAMEIASKEPSVKEVTKRKDPLGGAVSDSGSHSAESALPTTTSSQNPTQLSTELADGTIPQPVPSQIPPPDLSADLPADPGTPSQPPPKASSLPTPK